MYTQSDAVLTLMLLWCTKLTFYWMWLWLGWSSRMVFKLLDLTENYVSVHYWTFTHTGVKIIWCHSIFDCTVHVQFCIWFDTYVTEGSRSNWAPGMLVALFIWRHTPQGLRFRWPGLSFVLCGEFNVDVVEVDFVAVN